MPIGNPDDLSLRAIQAFKTADALICEERKIGAAILKRFGLELELYFLNEHTSRQELQELFIRLFVERSGTYALISDAGTPCFADPGADLVALCYQNKIEVKALPGASSLMNAIMLSGKRMERFVYYGFLSANRELRISELKQIKQNLKLDHFILEAPYRLKALATDMLSVFGKQWKIILFYRLSFPDEQVIRCCLAELVELSKKIPKGEFVLLLEA